jgi:hypothetical protein
MIGNAMSVNILKAVTQNLIESMSLIPEKHNPKEDDNICASAFRMKTKLMNKTPGSEHD